MKNFIGYPIKLIKLNNNLKKKKKNPNESIKTNLVYTFSQIIFTSNCILSMICCVRDTCYCFKLSQ